MSRYNLSMSEIGNPCREPLDCGALTQQERDLVAGDRAQLCEGASRLLPLIDRLNVVAKCNCGCPTIDFALDGEPVGLKGSGFISDWCADVDGMPVYVQLWVSNDRVCSLELGSLPGTDEPFGSPSIESIQGH